MHELILLMTGVVVGVMNAVAGGGMLVGFPVLVALGLPPLVVNATGNIVTIPGQLTSLWGYRSYLHRIPKRFALLILPLIIGSIAGALTLRQTDAAEFAQLVPWLVGFGVVLFAVQPYLHFHLHRHLQGKHSTWWPLLAIGTALLPLSFYGGYFGAGFGFMMLAFLSLTKLRDIHVMSAIKNLGAAIVSLTALLCLLSSGLVSWREGLLMATGAAVGGYVGARVSQRLSSHWLRIIVIVIGLSAVILLFVQSK